MPNQADNLADLGAVPDQGPDLELKDLGAVPELPVQEETAGAKALRLAKGVTADMIDVAGTTAGAAYGAAGGTVYRPGLGTAVGGAVGGALGNAFAQKTNQVLGLQPTFSMGQMVAGALGPLASEGSMVEAGIGKLLAAGTKAAAANVGAASAQTLIDEGHMPTATQAMIAAGGGYAGMGVSKAMDSGAGLIPVKAAADLNAVRDATLAEGRAAGLVVPPADTNPNMVTKTLGSIGGKAATKQQATIMNQAAVNAIAAKDIGLPVGQPITEEVIQAVQDSAYAPYQKIALISQSSAQDLAALRAQQAQGSAPDYLPPEPDGAHGAAVKASDPLYNQLAAHLETVSAADVNALRDARKSAVAAWQQFNKEGGATNQQIAENASATAQGLEDKIGAAATAIGDPVLLSQLQQARTLLAKTHVVEGATNFANGDVNARALGSLYKKGAPLTGGLATIGKFQQAFPQVMSPAASTPTPGVSKLGLVPSIVAGAVAGGEEHSALTGLATMAAAHAAPGFARNAMLSAPVQTGMFSSLAKPNYGTPQADLSALMARYGIMNMARPQTIPPYLAAPTQ